MVGYIYMTTNLVNNMKYIGKHKASVLELETYLGSGAQLKRAIAEFGRDKFKCEVLEICDSLDMLNRREKYWIAQYHATEQAEFYNIADGGLGSSGEAFGRAIKQAWADPEYRSKHVAGARRYWDNAENRTKRTEINRKADHVSAWTEERRTEQQTKMQQIYSDTDLRERLKDIQKHIWSDPDRVEKQRQQNLGCNNPSHGKHYYVDGEDHWVFCRPEDAPPGYYIAKYTWIYKDGVKLRHESAKPVPDGWTLKP